MQARKPGTLTTTAAIALVLALAFGAGRAVGAWRESGAQPQGTAPALLVRGERVPDAVLHGEGTRAVSVRSLARQASTPLVLVAMSTGCQSCDDDYPRWSALMAAYGPKARFALLVCAGDQASAAPLKSQMTGFDAVFLCDPVLRRNWGIDRLPAVVVLDSAAVVGFYDMGGPTARVTRDYLERAFN